MKGDAIVLKIQTLGELFCGPGGGGIGASHSTILKDGQEIRIKHKWASDIDRDSCQTYTKNINRLETKMFKGLHPVTVIEGDARRLPLEDPEAFPPVDGLMFGFPCNDFSIVGESKGTFGDFGPLYKQGIRILVRPDAPNWFIAENVGGIASANEGRAFALAKSTKLRYP